MTPKHQPRPAADLAPDLTDADRRRDLPETRPEELDERAARGEEIPAGGGFSPTEDGGNPDHPVHDEDEDDMMPEDYEREIDSLDGAVDKRMP